MNRTRKLAIAAALLLGSLCFAATTLINLATQVTGVLPIANGGTGTASTLTGFVRGNASAMTATELSGDGSTSGSGTFTLTHLHHQNFGTTTAPACSVGGTTTYIGVSNSSTTEASVIHFLPTENYAISKFAVGLAANVAASESAVFTVMDNNVGQAVTCTIAAGNSACTDNAHNFTTTGGSHIIDIKVVCSGGTTALTQPVFIGMGYK
jgi:hypothetical protein